MPRFAKEILSQGTYEVSTQQGRRKVDITVEDLEKYAETGTKMLKSGIKISAPWKHITNGQFVSPIEQVVENPDPSINAGFWDTFYVSLNDKGTKSLYGFIDAPGSLDQPDTPAYKVSRTVKDTSIGVLPNFKDGRGFDWGSHAIAHIALPLDPVEPGQSNFVPLPEGKEYLTIAMSRMVSSMSGTNLSEVLTLLKERGIELPADTTVETILDRLKVALMQKPAGSNPISTKPPSGKAEVYPIMLSLTQDQKDAILKAGVVDPATGKPFAPETFQDQTSDAEEKAKKSITMMSNILRNSISEKFKTRIAALVASNRINQKYADEQLAPLLNSYQMSIEGDKLSENTPLDMTLRALEAIPLPANAGQQQSNSGTPQNLFMSSNQLPRDAKQEPNTDANGTVMTDAEAAEIVKSIMGATQGLVF